WRLWRFGETLPGPGFGQNMSISTYLMHHCIRLLYFVLLFFMSHNYPLAAVCTRDCTSALYEHLCQHLSTGAFVQHLSGGLAGHWTNATASSRTAI
ncbi:hypothetical protein PSV09DRAFT_2297391, partial [Bipolaris maydis]|uniref:uncharacterized protein n=1 Tax=Cochliobolus heterostrophus TaxID=5016 RepID=UPI0024D0431F